MLLGSLQGNTKISVSFREEHSRGSLHSVVQMLERPEHDGVAASEPGHLFRAW